MKQFVIFDTASSQIRGYVQIDNPKDADLYPMNPAIESKLEVPPDLPALTNQGQYKIANGQLVQKNIVTLTASAPTFPADGASTVTLTFAGLNASANVQVAGQSVTVSPSDNVLTLTSDAPRSFFVQLNDADQWSNPVTVEAV